MRFREIPIDAIIILPTTDRWKNVLLPLRGLDVRHPRLERMLQRSCGRRRGSLKRRGQQSVAVAIMLCRSSVPPTYHSTEIFRKLCEDEGASLCATKIDTGEIGHVSIVGERGLSHRRCATESRKEIGRPEGEGRL